MLKRFIVRKYVMARSASSALRIEGRFSADECWLDEKWMDSMVQDRKPVHGFRK